MGTPIIVTPTQIGLHTTQNVTKFHHVPKTIHIGLSDTFHTVGIILF